MTTLTATPLAGTSVLPPRVLLQVTGAPNPPAPVYKANFATTVDGWTGAVSLDAGTARLLISSPNGSPTAVEGQRTVAGLTVGVEYEYRVDATPYVGGSLALIVRTTGGATIATLPATSGEGWRVLRFTATATSHVIVAKMTPVFTDMYEGQIGLDAVTVTAVTSWAGTTIYRTDLNGTFVVREDPGGQDVAGGTMTLTDYEAPLMGNLVYVVFDGASGNATTSATLATVTRRNTFDNPALATTIAGRWTFATNGQGTVSTSRLTGGPLVDGRNLDYYRGQWATITGGAIASSGPIAGSQTVSYIPVTPGPWTFSAYARAAGAGRTARLVATFHDAAGGALGGAVAGADRAITGPAWARLDLTTTVPAGAVRAYVRIYATAGPNWVVGDYFDATGFLSEAGAVLGDYFDGNTAPEGSTVSGWDGPAGLSQSVQTSPANSPGVWLTLPATAVPSTTPPTSAPVEMVLDYAETSSSNGSLHEIIGRADPIANPGPLSLRAGTLDVFCVDYASAARVRALLATGDVALLRQPTHPGMDMYFVAQSVAIAPAQAGAPGTPRRWVATVGYAEVVAA